MTFSDLGINKGLLKALDRLGFTKPTPIQAQAYKKIKSGRDCIGIAQTGTGKTYAYLLPIIEKLNYSEQKSPRALIIVPTRELAVQVEEDVKDLVAFKNIRFAAIYGGTNINNHRQTVFEGLDLIIATPGRLLDMALSKVLVVKDIKQLVIDEVDETLNLGFREQLEDLLALLPKKKQNLLFSATMTNDVENLIRDFFNNPITIETTGFGTALSTIDQIAYPVPNFYTKVNLLHQILTQESCKKVLVFVNNKRSANLLYDTIKSNYKEEEIELIHSNKTQNYRLRAIKTFEEGLHRILIATDILARGLDISNISHVINFDISEEAEKYTHRIGRTGRANKKGNAISFVLESDIPIIEEIEFVMLQEIPVADFPDDVEISERLTEQEMPRDEDEFVKARRNPDAGPAFHEKKDKNKKVNLGGSYRRIIAAKYKKPRTRGQKKK